MSSSSPDSSQELSYPPVSVSQSLARLDLRTLIMRSNVRHPLQEANSLDASAYEVLRDRTEDVLPLEDSDSASEDGGHTESLASTDGATPDNVSDYFDDDDDDDDDGDTFEHEPGHVHEATQPFESPPVHQNDSQAMAGGDDSTLTEVPPLGDNERRRRIMLQEESRNDGLAWAVTKEFDDSQVSGHVLGPYGCAEMRLAVQAALSSRFLSVGRPLRIWYVGQIEALDEKEISGRIGAALDASPGPSRSMMVGGQMEPCGPMLDVDHCRNIEVVGDTREASHVQVTLDDGTEATFSLDGCSHNIDDARLPDIVIFWYPHTGMPAPEVSMYPLVRRAFKWCGIPHLDIAADWRFGQYSKSFEPGMRNLRFNVEGKKNSDEGFSRQDCIPLDLWTFMHLDSLQLNRHLAALSPRLAAPEVSRNKPGAHRSQQWRGLLPGPMKGAGISTSSLRSATWKSLFSLALLTIMVASYFIAPTYLPLSYRSTPPVEGESLGPTSVHICRSGVTQSTSESIVSPTPSADMTTTSTSRDLTVVPSSGKPGSSRKQERKQKTIGEFDIRVTGDHQFFIAPPPGLFHSKRKPQLDIHVSRNAEAIPIRYVRTVAGMYIVDLEQEYPFGRFNVSIATHTKPLLQQTLEITLGHNKTTIAHFMELFASELATMRKRSAVIPGLVRASVVSMEDGWNELRRDWKQGAARSRHSKRMVRDKLEKAKSEAKRQLHAGAALLHDMTGATWLRVRRATAPARTSTAALRARNNAFRIRCGFERMVGLSSTHKGGKKSHSCKKMGW